MNGRKPRYLCRAADLPHLHPSEYAPDRFRESLGEQRSSANDPGNPWVSNGVPRAIQGIPGRATELREQSRESLDEQRSSVSDPGKARAGVGWGDVGPSFP